MQTSYTLNVDGIPTIKKVAGARLDYSFDFTEWLTPISDSIESATIVGSGLTVESPAIIGGVVTTFISGGTVGNTYVVTCTIVTADGREDSRSIELVIVAIR